MRKKPIISRRMQEERVEKKKESMRRVVGICMRH